MKNTGLITILLAIAGISVHLQAQDYDIVIVGGTPGGIMTAISAAREGNRCLIIERNDRVGGLPANGLGATDISTRGATTGLFTEFTGRIRKYYIDTYGENSPQVRDCSDGYHFEPSVAFKVFTEMLEEHKDKITVLTMRQFDCDNTGLTVHDGKIRSVTITDRNTGNKETYSARIFVDATYEGDLAAAAGIPFRVGRESYSEFKEEGAGRIYKYWEGAEDSGSTKRRDFTMPQGEGSTGQGDNAVQSYNYRLCLTDNPKNRIPFYKPENYDREEYVSLIDDVLTGRNTNYTMASVTEAEMSANSLIIKKGGKTGIPGDPWGIAKIVNMVSLPNGKTDANNQHLAFISTDLPEENWGWPTSSWEWRDKFSRRLKDYTLGLLWFAANDKSLPESFRKEISRWGFAADEYTDNRGFPRQVYVREGRRFRGEYFFTAHDATPVYTGSRPPVHQASISASHYALDSHGVRKREAGKIHLDGFLSYPTSPYTIPFGVMYSSMVDNLLFPVPVSGSHIGFSTLRMEPCWMALGQAAGIAASIAIDNDVKITSIPITEFQERLLDNGVTLIWFRDVSCNHPDFKIVQRMALLGFLPEWDARLDEPIDEATASAWKHIAGFDFTVTEGMTRKEALTVIYNRLK